MSLLNDFMDASSSLFGNPFGTMAYTTPDSTVGQLGALGGSLYLGGQGLMGLGNGSSSIFGDGTFPGMEGLPSIGDLTSLYNNFKNLIGGGGGNASMPSLDSLTKSQSLGRRVLPGAMALSYAAMQPNIDTSNLNNVLSGLRGNQNAIVQAATDPLQRNIAAGYGDLLQSQALRGIRGSSFGDTDIGNYVANTGSALANAGANAAQGSLALQGNLASQIAALQNENQKIKNSLYGSAFDVLGRGLNPQGYAANLGGTPMIGGLPTQQQPDKFQSLLNIGSSLGKIPVVGDVLGSIGDAIGSIF